jgi:hypothetical protein
MAIIFCTGGPASHWIQIVNSCQSLLANPAHSCF